MDLDERLAQQAVTAKQCELERVQAGHCTSHAGFSVCLTSDAPRL